MLGHHLGHHSQLRWHICSRRAVWPFHPSCPIFRRSCNMLLNDLDLWVEVFSLCSSPAGCHRCSPGCRRTLNIYDMRSPIPLFLNWSSDWCHFLNKYKSPPGNPAPSIIHNNIVRINLVWVLCRSGCSHMNSKDHLPSPPVTLPSPSPMHPNMDSSISHTHHHSAYQSWQQFSGTNTTWNKRHWIMRLRLKLPLSWTCIRDNPDFLSFPRGPKRGVGINSNYFLMAGWARYYHEAPFFLGYFSGNPCTRKPCRTRATRSAARNRCFWVPT